jgi:hypothetical protein
MVNPDQHSTVGKNTIENIGASEFPKQTAKVGTSVTCTFGHAPATVAGTIVRDDAHMPFVTIVKLSDGRHVLGRECNIV